MAASAAASAKVQTEARRAAIARRGTTRPCGHPPGRADGHRDWARRDSDDFSGAHGTKLEIDAAGASYTLDGAVGFPILDSDAARAAQGGALRDELHLCFGNHPADLDHRPNRQYPDPVSYTHLDVYKRQPSPCAE